MTNAIITATVTGAELQPAANFETLFYEWVSFLDVRPATVKTYTKGIRNFFSYLAANRITNPTREDIINYRDILKANRKPSTVQGYITAVRLFFQWMTEKGLYKQNIAARVKGAKIDAGFKKDYLTAAQAKRLLENIERNTLTGKRDYAMLFLMLTTGLRTISIIRANIEDIRPAGDAMALYYQGKGKDDKAEYVKLSEPVEVAINEYLSARGTAAGNSPLFAVEGNHNHGGRMYTESISRICKTRLRATGLNSDRLTAHSFRHTAATLNLLANGGAFGKGTIEETQQLLGHKNINTTMIYVQALKRAENQSESRITAAILSA